MSNGLYAVFKQRLLNHEMNFSSDTFKAVLGDSGTYVANLTSDDDLVDASAGTVATSPALTSPTISLGVFDTADFTWSAVSGSTCEYVLLYNDTHATKGLVLFFDTGIINAPVVPNGSNINVTVNANGWFSL